jgi:hypothetical protein
MSPSLRGCAIIAIHPHRNSRAFKPILEQMRQSTITTGNFMQPRKERRLQFDLITVIFLLVLFDLHVDLVHRRIL